MLPSTHGGEVGRIGSTCKNLFPESLLVAFTLVYHLFPLLLWNKLFLISHPIYSTLTFSTIFAMIELITFCHIWKWCKGSFKYESEEIGRKARNSSVDWSKRIAIFIACFCISHAVCVLFGAALTQNVQETATWALLVASIVAVPALCVFGSKVELWYRVILCGKFSNQIEQFLYYQTLGVIAGSWASAVVIPLDWDRDWQIWPIPCVMGCLIGYVAAVVIHCIVSLNSMKGAKGL